MIYTGDLIQLVKDKDVSVQSGHSDTFLVHIHTCARAAVCERKSDLYSWPKQSSEGFLTLYRFVKTRIETENRQHEEPYIYSKKTKTSKTV